MVKWPGFLLANFALFTIIGISAMRESYRDWSVEREIKALEEQAAALENGKLELEQLTKVLVSPERIEYEARARLGRKKSGERVIVLEGMVPAATWTGGISLASQPEQTAAPELSNPQKWWRYFIK